MLMIIRQLKIYLVPLFIFGLLLIVPKSFAATTTPNSLICGSTSQTITTLEDITTKNVPTGKVYLRLNYASNPINLSLYLNNYSAGKCSKIGSAQTNSNSWTYVGTITNTTNDVIIQGSGVGAAPYQAAVQLLVVTDNQCVPTTNCSLKYAGLNGILQLDDSNILSGATDQIAIYGLKPISRVGVASVGYYADNQKSVLYTTTTLRAFNRNYLDGGLHNTQIQIKLGNGQSIYVNQTIDMGIDWTGSLYLKSLIYRDSGSAAVFIIIGIAILIILLIFSLTRLIYKKQRFNEIHGINSYANNQPNNLDQSKYKFFRKI